jgi:hypothetical protein
MTNHIGDCQKDKDEGLQTIVKKSLQMLETVQDVLQDMLCGVGSRLGNRSDIGIDRGHGAGIVNCLEMLQSQSGRGGSVELCNSVQNLDGLGFSASADQELG